METRPVVAVALAVLFVTAGCQAPVQQGATAAPENATATTDGTTQAAPEETELVRVTDELPFRVTPIYERVGRMLGVPEAERPTTVVGVEEPPQGDVLGAASTSGFTNLVGIEPLPSAGEGGGVSVGAVARGTLVTLFDHPNASVAWKENVLAHEFVHVYQTRLPTREGVDDLDRRRNHRFLKSVVTEDPRSTSRSATPSATRTRRGTRRPSPPGGRTPGVRPLAPRALRVRLAVLRTPTPERQRVTDVYEDPPGQPNRWPTGAPRGGTGEGAVGGPRGHGQRVLSDACDDEGRTVRQARALDGTRLGARGRRLRGWGMDRLLHVSGDHGANTYAWVLRWDDASEAAAFREAFADYDASNGVAFRTEAVTDETVVVYAGDEAFVENASATGNSSDVTVRV